MILRTRATSWSDLSGVVLLILAAGLLAACGAPAGPTGATAPTGPAATAAPTQAAASTPALATELLSSAWELSSLRGRTPLPGTHITLEFGDQALSGFTGCNYYGGGPDSGRYAATADGAFQIGPKFAVTVILCPEDITAQEKEYIAALTGASAFRLDGDRLELQDAAGQALLAYQRQPRFDMEPAGLLGTGWRLLLLDGRPPVAGTEITLVFLDDASLGGHSGCRGYVCSYQAAGDGLTLSFTAMMGPLCSGEAAQAQEGLYTDALGNARRYQLAADRLEISTVRGETLVFEAIPEPDPSALLVHPWSLLAFVDPNPVEGLPSPLPMPTDVISGTTITLSFGSGAVRGSAGCNTYLGAYGIEIGSLSWGPISVTEMACLTPEGVMEQERRYLGSLPAVTVYRLVQDRLWLLTGDGRALVLVPQR